MTYALDKLTFNFVPESMPLPDVTQENLDGVTANDVYRNAYRMVYNEWPRNDLGKHWQAAAANARAAEMDFKTFCLFVIAGYAVTHEFTKFFPSNLAAASGPEKIDGYRKACKRKFNSSDARSLGLMLNLEFYDIDEEMLLSETKFARNVVGLIVHGHGDEDIPFYVYDHDEIAFSPYWLSLEPTYQKTIFMPFIKQSMKVSLEEKKSLGTEAQLRHRHLVSQVVSALKRRSHLASTIFSSRSRIMPKAVKAVLAFHGLKLDTPISDVNEINDAFEFWTKVGTVCSSQQENYGTAPV